MNWNKVEGFWTQIRGKLREEWGKALRSEADIVIGRREQLVGRLQRRYGAAQAQGESSIRAFDNTRDA